MRNVLLLSLIFTLVPTLASAQIWPALDSVPDVAQVGRNDVAVLVAVEDYLFVPRIPGARQNLSEWEVFLRKGLGVPTVTTLVNEQATREEVLAAAESAALLAGPDSTVWFLFIGHGAPALEGGDGTLLGADAQQTTRSLAARGIGRSELIRTLEAGQHKRIVVVLDACFSGRASDGTPLVPGAQPLVPVADEFALGENTVVLSAAASSEFAGPMPGLDRPAFSYLVLGGLRGWANDGDGRVTAEEAVVFARHELLTVSGRRQTPGIAGLRDTVLSSDARETRPTRPVAVEAPVTEGLELREPRTFELAPPSRLHASFGIGAAAETTYETATPLIDAGVRLRLSNPRSSTRFTLVAGLGYANVTNVFAREIEGLANDALSGTGLQTRIDVGTTTHMLTLGIGPGMEVGRGPLRFFGDLRGGLALPLGGECRAWEFYDNLEAASCTDRESDVSPAFGSRLGVGYRMFELTAQAGFLPRKYSLPKEQPDGSIGSVEKSQTLFVAGLTAGIGFDL